MQTPAIGSALSATDSVAVSYKELLERYRNVRAATLALTESLSAEDVMVQSCAEASPVKWHMAHTSWFFETFVLRDSLVGYKDFHPEFHWLFNSYYNSLGEMPAKTLRSSFSRPAFAEILAYRVHVDAAVARLLEGAISPVSEDAARRIVLGLEHEQQHQELIATDIKHAFFTNPLHPIYREASGAAGSGSVASPLEWTGFSPGLVEIGFAPDVDSLDAFCFDNETPRHKVYLAPFALANRLVTCAEYLAFIDDNGYMRPELWLSEGWTTIREQGWQAPLYWQRDASSACGWRVFTLHGWRRLEEMSETPVCHLSFFEADAYARWVARQTPGARLPTEFEWEFAASRLGTRCCRQSAQPELRTWTAGESAVDAACASDMPTNLASRANLLETGSLHPAPTSARPGLQQIFGDAWEWTSSAYVGYPGYRPLPGALGEYNGKFMSSQVILRGGSCVTPATHIRATYRNFFAPGTRWQFSGLRLARDGS